MGEFLTESSRVENMMLSVVIACQPHRPLDDVFEEFTGKAFGPKICEFKRVCKAYQFTDEQRAILASACKELDVLLEKRNDIVHGLTLEVGNDDIPVQPYRIGMRKGDDLDSINRFVAKNFNVERVEKLAAVTAELEALKGKIAKVATELMQSMTGTS